MNDLLKGEQFPEDTPFPAEAEVLGFTNQAAVQHVTVEMIGDFQALAESSAVMISELWMRLSPGMKEDGLARDKLEKIISKLFRRSPKREEIERYTRYYTKQSQQYGAVIGLRNLLTALLMSPKFWYRVETGGDAIAGTGRVRLNDYEMLARLSFLLWSSHPTWQLHNYLRRGHVIGDNLGLKPIGLLYSSDQIRSLAERMFNDPVRVGNMLMNFHSQWLGLRLTTHDDLFQVHKVPPEISEAFSRFIFHIVWEKEGSLTDLLTTPIRTYNWNLARFFDVPADQLPQPIQKISPQCLSGVEARLRCTRGGKECPKDHVCLADLSATWTSGPSLCVSVLPKTPPDPRGQEGIGEDGNKTQDRPSSERVCSIALRQKENSDPLAPTKDWELDRANLGKIFSSMRTADKDMNKVMRLLETGAFKAHGDRVSVNIKKALVPSACARELCLPGGSLEHGWAHVHDKTFSGLLTQPLVLAAHAEPENPYLGMVRRGKLIRERLLCHEVKPPPPSIPPIPSNTRNKTPRELLEEHTRSGSCRSCHIMIDPMGTPFENFDSLGRKREKYSVGAPIKPDGHIYSTLDINGPVRDVAALNRKLSESDQVRSCYIRQWFRFAFGRIEDEGDKETLDELFQKFEASGYKIKALILAITETTEFQTLRLNRTPSPPTSKDRP